MDDTRLPGSLIPGPDLFGPTFQTRGYAYGGDANYDSDDDDGYAEVDDEYHRIAQEAPLPSIELPDFPSPYSGDGSEAATPDSYDNGEVDSDELDDGEGVDEAVNDEPDTLGLAPWTIPASDDVPKKRPRGRPRRKTRTGQRGGWNQGQKVGPRPPLEPTPEFTEKYQAALNAYSLDGDLDSAHELIVEAIAINPEVFNAHILLSQIWEDRGDSSNAVQALWTGAHCSSRDPFVWQKVVEACLERATYSRIIALNQARYALKAILRLDPTDCESLFQLASVEREAGRPKQALDLLDKIMLEMPHNTHALKMYAETCIYMEKVGVAINRYKEAILHYRVHGLSDEDSFEWTDIYQYVDLLTRREGDRDVVLQTSINVLKKLSRWLLGRSIEAYWDMQEDDDAEFDQDDMPRRIAVPGYQVGRFSADQYGIGLPIPLRAQLGILRLKQGYSRKKLWIISPGSRPDDVQSERHSREHQEASRYFEALLRVDSEKGLDFWLGIGANAYVVDKKANALEHFQAAVALDEDSVVAKTYICKILTEQGNKPLAIKYGCEAVEAAHAEVPMSVKGLRKYERIDHRLEREAAEDALKTALQLQGPAPSKKRPGRRMADDRYLNAFQLILPGGGRDYRHSTKKQPKRLPRAPTPVEDKPQKVDDFMAVYSTLLTNHESMQAGDPVATRVWMECAKAMINDFRSEKIFFPREKHQRFIGYDDASVAASRRPLYEKTAAGSASVSAAATPQPTQDADSALPSVEPLQDASNIPTSYREISFTTWLDIFLEYALLLSSPISNPLSHSAQRDTYTALSNTTLCVIWVHDPPSMLLIHLVHLVCCINLQDQITLFGNTDPFRLVLALQNLFPYPQTSPFGKPEALARSYLAKSSKPSKFLFRHLAAIDHWLETTYTDPTTGEAVPAYMRKKRDDTLTVYAPLPPGSKSTQRIPQRTQEMDAVLLVLYGQLHFCKGQYLSALPWFHRARALVPEEPLVAFLMALCYLQQPLKPGFRNSVALAGGAAQARESAASIGGSVGDKHNWVLMGVAMMEEYAALRLKLAELKDRELGTAASGQKRAEAEREIAFNRARCWAMLGLEQLATDGFEGLLLRAAFRDVKVEQDDGDAMDIDYGPLSAAAEGGKEYSDMDMQSAYALRTSYALSGNMDMARSITERFLVC
ncbi:Transcription factor tau subunit sfc4 [Cyphellophora attinorum]|uniref:Transcription factor tau subunit sfc4 n=1 Tax=Cyphellophora attinorum TaxID=1664694 RepID=A0A0N1H3A0_9EURO|nr:Transcription factor tau subunit sfc4 [Phialophora attinorum]KPI34833.1 Transcription factor tau subunit sfc4 [Phialophora attinorum]